MVVDKKEIAQNKNKKMDQDKNEMDQNHNKKWVNQKIIDIFNEENIKMKKGQNSK